MRAVRLFSASNRGLRLVELRHGSSVGVFGMVTDLRHRMPCRQVSRRRSQEVLEVRFLSLGHHNPSLDILCKLRAATHADGGGAQPPVFLKLGLDDDVPSDCAKPHRLSGWRKGPKPSKCARPWTDRVQRDNEPSDRRGISQSDYRLVLQRISCIGLADDECGGLGDVSVSGLAGLIRILAAKGPL